MKRLILVLSLLFLTACSANKIPDGFEESTLKIKVEQIVDFINDSKFEETYLMFRSDIQTMLTFEDFETVIQTKLDQVGEFKKISQIAITETKDPDTSEVYALTIVVCEHEEGKTTYTLSFNDKLEMVGFYIK